MAVLGLLLLLLAIALLVPIRYRISGKKETSVDAKIQVHWLLHLVSVLLLVEQGKVTVGRVKLCGFTLIDFLSGKEKAKAGQNTEPQEVAQDAEGATAAGSSDANVSEALETASAEQAQNSTANSTAQPSEAAQSPASEINASGQSSEKQSNKKKKHSSRKKKKSKRTKAPLSKRLSDEFERFCNTIDLVLDRLDDGIDAFWDKVSPILDTISTYYTFATEDATVRLIKKVLATVVDFIKYILPVKLRGNLHLGMAEPAATGQICSIMAVLLPWYGSFFTFTPDFEKQVVEGEINCKGRIRLGHFAWKVLLLICNKDLWHVIKQWKAISAQKDARKRRSV